MSIEYRKAFWAALLALALASALGAWWLFPRAMPLLRLQVSLSRDQALEAAARLQSERFPELSTARAVAAFEHDDELQNYLELEGGGVEAYTALLGQRFIAPYAWSVRRFSEAQEDELRVRFTPEGQDYGFTRKLPEKAPGAALAEAAARATAQTGARTLLGDALWNAYAPLSASQVTRPGGRVDHSFVYEHQGERRGEARFRLKLVVAGNQLVEVTPYAFVPEAFEQRFKQLRAGNDVISKVATIALFGLFGLGGLLGGWIWLARRRTLAWRPALLCSSAVGVLAAGAVLSSLPLRWLGYATTESASNFLLSQLAIALVAALATTLLLGWVFAVAEGLSRHAFARHPRLFSFWSVAGAASPQALGRTLGGYAWMAIELLLVSGFYLVARTQFGWWVPAESLSDPNILSAWRPALEPIANALQAGTMEEALFRAVPLAAAALIGERLGWRRTSIAIGLVLQALVFAGAHANYPGLPSYSRLVELFVPALIWGLIFLRYGLLPCMLMHFTFDLTLMSLPLFVASDPRLWLDRALVLAAALTPLALVVRARLKQGRWAELPAGLRNGVSEVWATPDASAPDDMPLTVGWPPTHSPLWLRPGPLLAAATAGALVLCLWPTPQLITPTFTVDRAGAIERAQGVLAERGVRLDADWKRLAVVRPVAADADSVRFVWREAGPKAFASLLEGGQIAPAHWRVMFRRVQGPVEERSEDWEVALTGQGELLAVFHHLPEARPGAKLEREQAQALVQAFMQKQAALVGRPWELASVQEIERPARRDWVFRWDDKKALDVKGGSARVSLNVRGDEVDAWQHIFVPDAWSREQQTQDSAKTPFKIAAGLAGGTLALLLLGLALRQAVRGQLRWSMGLSWGALLFVSAMASWWLGLDHKAMEFNVAQDWDTQRLTAAALAAVGTLLGAALFGLLAMCIPSGPRPNNARVASDMLRGLALILVLKGAGAVLAHLLPQDGPALAGVGPWDSLQPLLSTLFQGPVGSCVAVANLAMLTTAMQFCRTRGRTAWLVALISVLAISAVWLSDSLASGSMLVLLALLNLAIQWALLQRGDVGVVVAMVCLLPLAHLPQLLALPIANAASLAAVSCAVALAMAWWTLRLGLSLGARRT